MITELAPECGWWTLQEQDSTLGISCHSLLLRWVKKWGQGKAAIVLALRAVNTRQPPKTCHKIDTQKGDHYRTAAHFDGQNVTSIKLFVSKTSWTGLVANAGLSQAKQNSYITGITIGVLSYTVTPFFAYEATQQHRLPRFDNKTLDYRSAF